MDEPVRALDVTRAFIGDLTLTFGEGDEKRDYVISGDLDIETMIAMLAIEQRVQGSDTIQDLLTHLHDAQALILSVVRTRYPDAVLPKLSPRQINRTFSWLISGGTTDTATAEKEVLDAMLEGYDPDAAERSNVGGDVMEPTRELDSPLASEKPSDEPSSSSATITDGGRSGGEESVGESSVSTSTPLTVV